MEKTIVSTKKLSSKEIKKLVESHKELEEKIDKLLMNRAFQIQTTTELANEIAKVTSIDKIYKLVVHRTKERFGYYHVNLYRLDNDRLIAREATGKEGRAMIEEPRVIPLYAKKSLVAKAAREGKSLLVEDVTKSKIWLFNPYLPETKAEIAIPLKLKNKVIGVLDVQSKEVNGLSKEDELLLLGICGQIAVAIDYEKTKDDLKKHQLNLEKLVRKRTMKLEEINNQLKNEIKQRKQTEIKLKKAKKVAEELLKLKQEFLANMNHELRTPLTTVIGMANILAQTNLSVKQLQYTNIIKQAADNLIVIVNDILSFSQIESNSIVFSNETHNIFKFLKENIDSIMFNAQKKNIKLLLTVDNSIPQYLVFDKVRLGQILLNLVSNAIKFTSKGQVEISVKIKNENEKNITLTFEVKDSGIGISKKNLSKIFQSFTQGEGIATKFGGTGLGLTIAKRLVELQKGELYVKSILGKGSEFSFNLTFEKPNDKDENKRIVKKENDLMKFNGRPNILMVEDNKSIQVLVNEFLKEWGADVSFADNGKIAIEILNKSKFNLMLLDLRMPVMDGFETLEKMKELKLNNLPVIGLTAYTDKEDLNKAKIAGMIDCIIKPFQPNDLFYKVKEYL